MAKAQAAPSAKAAAKKRVVKVDSSGDAHINATFNNIIVSITNKNGQVIAWSSAGKMGFKGSKKNTPYAAQMAASDAAAVRRSCWPDAAAISRARRGGTRTDRVR